jgi:Ca2+-binding RTX toxin-like protein
VVVSPDGGSVYATSTSDNAVARFSRNAGSGALTYQGCITGETESGPSGSDACAAIPSAAGSGDNSGLGLPASPVVTAGSSSLYVVAQNDAAVAGFARNTGTGALTYQGCLTGETESGPTGSNACAQIPTASSFADQSGLSGLHALAASADGASLYATARFDTAVAAFTRNPGTGALAYQGCVTGETESGPAGSSACAAIPSATPGGNDSGLANPFAVTVSPGGASAYVATENDDGVANFDRDSTGLLAYQGCISGEIASGPSGSNACTLIPSATSNGGESGLDKPRSLVVSPDNASLYLTSPADDAVARFGREPESAPTPPPPSPYDETCFGITVNGSKTDGTASKDNLKGTAQSDRLKGKGGNDNVRGRGAADCLFGNADKDKVKGQGGGDVVRGGSGNDRLSGGSGDDNIRAQDGDDKVSGGSGDDFIKAQARGRDKVNCGSGNDRVVGDVKDKIAKNCERVRLVNPN